MLAEIECRKVLVLCFACVVGLIMFLLPPLLYVPTTHTHTSCSACVRHILSVNHTSCDVSGVACVDFSYSFAME